MRDIHLLTIEPPFWIELGRLVTFAADGNLVPNKSFPCWEGIALEFHVLGEHMIQRRDKNRSSAGWIRRHAYSNYECEISRYLG